MLGNKFGFINQEKFWSMIVIVCGWVDMMPHMVHMVEIATSPLLPPKCS